MTHDHAQIQNSRIQSMPFGHAARTKKEKGCKPPTSVMENVKRFFPSGECRKEKGVRFLLPPTSVMGSLILNL
jgi:hypothetical protein